MPAASDDQSPVLRVRDLEVAFPGARGVLHAVNRVSFDLHRGETLGVVGESGCGKSTIGRALMGLVPAPGIISGGSIELQGEDLTKASKKRLRQIRGNRIAMIFQDPMSALNPVMTIGTQLRESLGIHTSLHGGAATRRAIELLDLVGIPDAKNRMDSYPHQLSGGMRQRVCIAMAISCDPTVLVADEPTTALDVTVQAQVVELLDRLRRELGMAIILISHDLGVVAGIADRIMVVYGGSVVESGAMSDVIDNTTHPYTQGLIGSRTEIDGPRPDRLRAIPGVAPALMGPALECPFRERCPLATDVCAQSNPLLTPVAPGHEVACHVRAAELIGTSL